MASPISRRSLTIRCGPIAGSEFDERRFDGKAALIDSHCHLDFDAFQHDRSPVWSRCLERGLTHLLIPGTDPEQWLRAAALCEQNDGWVFAAGVHPWWQSQQDDKWLAACRHMLQHPLCVAVGECGLDKRIDTPMDQQLAWLDTHLALAQEARKPVILHCVKAHNELIRCLKRYRLPEGGVVHAFSGSADQARTYWQMGLRLGVGGVITYERARKTRDAVAVVPVEALLLETDAPDMPLAGRQGERNSPEYLPEIAVTLAQLRGAPVEDIARQTSDNARALFRL